MVSRVACDWAWALSATPAQKRVHMAFAERADDKGRCSPSLAHLIRMTGLARSTVAVVLQGLEAARRIVRVRGGGGKSTRCQLLLGESDAVAVGTWFEQLAADDSPGTPAGNAIEDHLDRPSRARVSPGADSRAVKNRVGGLG